MTTSSVLHGYYQLGGESFRDDIFRLDEALNKRISGVPLGIPSTVVVEESDQPIRQAVRTHHVPAFHYDDPAHLKLSLFLVRGKSAKNDFVMNRLAYKLPNFSNSGEMHYAPADMGIAEHLKQNYSVGTVACNSLIYRYDGLDRTGRPMGSVHLEIDKESAVNEEYFHARDFCMKAIRAVSSQVGVYKEDTIKIGSVNIQNTSSERVEQVVNDLSIDLAEHPIIAEVGKFVLKNKLLEESL